MTQQLEDNLRRALAARAAEVPAKAGDRLRQIDYHPRTHRVRPPVALGALAGTAGATGAIVAVLGAGASNAFAGWTASPTRPSQAQIATADATCQSRLASYDAGLPLKLTDTRGPFTFEVYANDQSSASCISGPSFTAETSSQSSAPAQVPVDQVATDQSHLATNGGQPYSFAEGRAGADVTAATLQLTDGTTVKTTLANGWFVAWWPSSSAVKAVDVTTPTGVITQPVAIVPGPPGAPPPGSGATSGSSSGTGSISGARGGSSQGSVSVTPWSRVGGGALPLVRRLTSAR